MTIQIIKTEPSVEGNYATLNKTGFKPISMTEEEITQLKETLNRAWY